MVQVRVFLGGSDEMDGPVRVDCGRSRVALAFRGPIQTTDALALFRDFHCERGTDDVCDLVLHDKFAFRSGLAIDVASIYRKNQLLPIPCSSTGLLFSGESAGEKPRNRKWRSFFLYGLRLCRIPGNCKFVVVFLRVPNIEIEVQI